MHYALYVTMTMHDPRNVVKDLGCMVRSIEWARYRDFSKRLRNAKIQKETAILTHYSFKMTTFVIFYIIIFGKV